MVTDEHGNALVDDEESTDHLNDCFISVYPEKDRTPTVLTDKRCTNEMPELEITEEKVLNILQKLNVNKSTGPDNIPAILLRRAAEAFKVPLTLLLRRSYDEGNVPSLMKNANVTPLFKGGKIKTANHFRSISLTPISAKVAERL